MSRLRSSRVLVVAWSLGAMALPVRADLLSFVQAQVNGQGGVEGLNGASSVVSSPDGRHVYVAGVGDNAVAVFRRDAATGQLMFAEVADESLSAPGSVTVSPDGKNVYVASFGAVVVFRRDAASGALSFLEAEDTTVHGLVLPHSVAPSPDGSYVYVASSQFVNDELVGAVAVFRRDSSTGALAFVDAQFNGQGGVEGLSGADSVAVSPGGAHVYVASFFGDAVAVFSSDAMTGALTFIETQFDRQGGVQGLDGAESVAVSSDGANVYVASSAANAVASFHRSPSTGALTFVEALFNGQAGVEGIEGAASVAVSPDGAYVYVASTSSSAVAAFRRDTGTGRLSFVEAQFDGEGGVDGLGGADAVSVSADGAHVYVAAGGDAAVGVFRVMLQPTATPSPTGTPTPTPTATRTSTTVPTSTSAAAAGGRGGGCRIADEAEPNVQPIVWILLQPVLLWVMRCVRGRGACEARKGHASAAS